jgi:hypothetical protein
MQYDAVEYHTAPHLGSAAHFPRHVFASDDHAPLDPFGPALLQSAFLSLCPPLPNKLLYPLQSLKFTTTAQKSVAQSLFVLYRQNVLTPPAKQQKIPYIA